MAQNPPLALVFDKEDNLYGTTAQGGAYSVGTVFELTAAGTEKVLYSFGDQSGDGSYPQAGLIFDKKGNLYGTTSEGGAYSNEEYCSTGCGTVFELTAAGTEKVLYNFGGHSGDGTWPSAALVFDKKGNLYSTTENGGEYGGEDGGYGTVFEITAAGKEKVLHSFGSHSGDGIWPYAGLVFGKKDNLYGTTHNGGANSYGTVFEMTTAGTEKVLHSFGSHSGDGVWPDAGLVFYKEGNLYGTTHNGGKYNNGTVFEVTP